jgi:hypothetical protein
MREFENGTKVNKYTAHPRNYEILKNECGVWASKIHQSANV